MRRVVALLALCGTVLALAAAGPLRQEPSAVQGPRFEAWDLFVDSGDGPLAAWQIRFVVAGEGARIGGVEGGEHPAFAEAPYYDPEALQGGRIVVASFSTGTDLPRGRTRVARLHLILDAGAHPRFDVNLEACAGTDGTRIEAEAETALTEKR